MRTIILFILIFFFSFSVAQQEYFTIKNYDVQLKVNKEGMVDIREEIKVEFDTLRRGIFRRIPMAYSTEQGKLKFNLSNINVENWNYKVYDEGNEKVIRIGKSDEYINGEQEYIISYKAKNAFLWHEDRAELYWNIIGTGWPVPIEKINYEVEFPEELDIEPDEYKIFTGQSGQSDISASIQKRGNRIYGSSSRVFKPNEGLTLAVLLPTEMLEKGSVGKTLNKAWQRESKFATIPAFLALLLFGAWRKYGSNETLISNVKYKYYAPDELSAAEAGLFIDNQANARDIVALIPEWGNKGIIKVTSDDLNTKKKADHTYIERLSSLPEEYPKYQHILFDEIFKDRDFVKLSDLQNKMYKNITKITKHLRKEVKSKNLYDEMAYKIFHSGWMIVVFFILLICGILSMAIFKLFMTGIVLIILGIVAFILHFLSPKKTSKGQKLHQNLKAFKSFLKDKPTNKMSSLFSEDKGYFEKVYPYVVAFGFDKSFVVSAKDYSPQVPTWYMYHHLHPHFRQGNPNFTDFSTSFSPKYISSAFTSSPHSAGSGSGGGFSGGSSGGGIGGGGGGSW